MATGTRRALLVGCNYPNSKYELHGCINDVQGMKAMLRNHFAFMDIEILTDDENKKPTLENITETLEQMIKNAGEEDILFFYFSGSGTLVPSAGNANNECIPAIVSSDFRAIDADRFRFLVEQSKAMFTFVCDSSYSGGLFDENAQIPSNDNSDIPHGGYFHGKTIPFNPKLFPNTGANLSKMKVEFTSGRSQSGTFQPEKGILLSSSKANQESVEVYPNGDKSKAFGAYTFGIQTLFNAPLNMLHKAPTTNREVFIFLRALLGSLQFNQQPNLYCSEENVGKPFLGGGA